ncbi:MAG: hypothetical protein ACI9GW_002202 [Halieaceae bacterium]|jgi:hypothetical protein
MGQMLDLSASLAGLAALLAPVAYGVSDSGNPHLGSTPTMQKQQARQIFSG